MVAVLDRDGSLVVEFAEETLLVPAVVAAPAEQLMCADTSVGTTSYERCGLPPVPRTV